MKIDRLVDGDDIEIRRTQSPGQHFGIAITAGLLTVSSLDIERSAD